MQNMSWKKLMEWKERIIFQFAERIWIMRKAEVHFDKIILIDNRVEVSLEVLLRRLYKIKQILVK